ncbi:amidase [Thalassotalea marina]|uniref:Amidase n=1 Tax=Thalassotalea marina TaxID=1673741 RepID=A0A919BEQ0_9GAMM|nr:amidase [Thalassotalea marina]GHF83161.1 amidase [Thalassotalea marina]
MRELILCLALIFSCFSFADIGENTNSNIREIHKKFTDGTLNSEQLVSFYLKRIEQLDRNGLKLNSVSQLNPHALEQAKALDKRFVKEGLTGPLHGIPVLLKDNIDTVDDMSNSAGSLALAKHFPKDDAFLVKRLKAAGAIIIGKTNLSEWANFRSTASSSGWSSMYGQTKNPHDLTRSPCGSSSGSGAAIAANLAVIAVGTETDGSVTCPSAVNGIIGIKPTLGTVSRDGIIPIAHSQDTAGPMARTVTDAVILLSASIGYDSEDPSAIKTNSKLIEHLKLDGLKGKRIGVVRNLTGYHNATDQVFEQALTTLKQQGATIVDDLAFSEKDNWGGAEFEVLLFEFKHGLNQYLADTDSSLPKTLSDVIAFNKQHADKVMPYFKQEIMLMAQSKGSLTSDSYLNSLKKAKAAAQQQGIDKLLADNKLDLLIAPTTGPAWKIDKITGDHYLGAASSAAAIAGYPHITVPMGFVHHLPVGLSFFAGKLSEPTLIEAAFAFEQATLQRKTPKAIKTEMH